MNRRRDMRRNMFGAVCGVVAGVVALAGCTSDDTPPSASASSTGGSSTRTAATSSTPTPTRSLTPEEQDLRSAEEAITEYWKVIDEAASNPNQNLNVLATVARSQALAQWQFTLAGYRSKSWVQRGSSTVENARATTKDGADFTVIACRDASAIDVVDSSGKSVVRSDGLADSRLHLHGREGAQGFFVIEDLLKGSPCTDCIVSRRSQLALLMGARRRGAAAPPVTCPPGKVPDPKTGSCTIVLNPPPSPGRPGEPGTPSGPGGGGSKPAVKPVCRFSSRPLPRRSPARMTGGGGCLLVSATRRRCPRSRRSRTRRGRAIPTVSSTNAGERCWARVGRSVSGSGQRRHRVSARRRTRKCWRGGRSR